MAKRTRNATGIGHWLSHGKLKDVWMADAASRTSIINEGMSQVVRKRLKEHAS